MRSLVLAPVFCSLIASVAPAVADDALPFSHKVEVYRDKAGDVMMFTVRLEQPFLAEEFEKSSYLRLRSSDPRAYLIYPQQTTFRQKHAEFYGRLRGEGKVELELSYEIVSENLDGSRRVEVRTGKIEVPIPTTEVGPKTIFLEWAKQQNQYFASLLRYYPEETFYQYCLLQSQARYGVAPPPVALRKPDSMALETDLYQVFTRSSAIQESLQRGTLGLSGSRGDLNTHVSTLQPPVLRSLPYADLLKQKREEEQVEPSVHPISQLVPQDQYFLHFNQVDSLIEIQNLTSQWGNRLFRLLSLQAEDQQLRAKLEDQLCLRRDDLVQLAADGAVGEVALTGADPFVLEGTDLTMIFRLKRPDLFVPAARKWVEEVSKKYPEVMRREFNYRGHRVVANYTNDRVVSSFVVQHEDYLVYSNSHRAIRRIVDAAVGVAPNLHDALDYRYVTTILPPSDEANSGYFFTSEAALRRLVGPAAKISEKRRLECYNNLVMLNNASLFYRLEYGRSPETLSDLIEGRFVDPKKIVCPHGGAYAFDVEHDTCTCSLHNRLKYLTPNVELSVLNVSRQEASEYERYKQRYAAFWQKLFGPVSARLTVAERLKVESCVLPMLNGEYYRELKQIVDQNPQPIGTARIAPSAVGSVILVPGRENIAQGLSSIPGVTDVLKANPTLTDLKWLGDRLGVHVCDGETILEIDPTQFRSEGLPMIGSLPLQTQMVAASLVTAAKMPVYVTIDVENREKAAQLLEKLSEQIFLNQSNLVGLQVNLDAYRLPDYKQHPIYVFSGQLYAVKVRLHAALVGDQLVAATKPEILREVIDTSTAEEKDTPVEAHVLLRFNRRAMDRMLDDMDLYWSEKSRLACHRNIISVYTLAKLYNAPIDEIGRLSDAKYGVRYFCPEDGQYHFDAARDEVVCSVHGNREHSLDLPQPERKSSFAEFIESFDEVVAALRYGDDAMIVTVEIDRSGEQK